MTSKIILLTKFKGGVGATHCAALLTDGLAQTEPTLFADFEPQGDGAQVLAVPIRSDHGTVKDFVHQSRSHVDLLLEVPTAPHGYYVAPDSELNRATAPALCDPDRLREAADRAGMTWVVVDTVKAPDPRALRFIQDADLVLHVVANAFGVRTVTRTHEQLQRHARRGPVHTLINRVRKDNSENALLDDLADGMSSRLSICPVHIGHDGWVANALRHRRSPFAVGNARATHQASTELAEWAREQLAHQVSRTRSDA